MIDIDDRGYFITGSDTDVGKTYIACQLIQQLRQLNRKIEVRKPAESGCIVDESSGLIAADAAQLESANNNLEASSTIAPYRFKAALAPHRAARLEGKKLILHDLIEACRLTDEEHLLVVEGAGGFYSPMAEDGLNADLATALGLPVVIVVDDRVGAVNQALLTIQAVESRGLSIASIILNRVNSSHEANMDNFSDLSANCSYPIFQCLYQQALPMIFTDEFQHD